jgi:hypothetical protein
VQLVRKKELGLYLRCLRGFHTDTSGWSESRAPCGRFAPQRHGQRTRSASGVDARKPPHPRNFPPVLMDTSTSLCVAMYMGARFNANRVTASGSFGFRQLGYPTANFEALDSRSRRHAQILPISCGG